MATVVQHDAIPSLQAHAAKRLFDIDPLRGFVCFCLMGFHFVSTSLYEPLHLLGGEMFDIVVWKLRLGVESFFVLAGFMVAHSLRPIPGEQVSYTKYFGRRWVRLWQPYSVAVLLAAANMWLPKLLLERGRDAPTVSELLAQLTLTQELFSVPEAAIGFWSLVTLEQFYVGWLLLLFVADRLRSTTASSVVSLLVGLTSFALLAWQVELVWALPLWAGYLVLGIALYDIAVRGRNRTVFGILLVALFTAGCLATTDHKPIKALVASFLLWCLGSGWRFPGGPLFRCLRYLGQRSYSTYLTHGIVGYRVFSLYPKVEQYGYLAVFGLLCGAFAASLLIGEIFYRCVEVPCLHMARRLQYRRPLAETVAVTLPAQK